MFIDGTTRPLKKCKKAQAAVDRTLVILILVWVLIGIVSYIIYTKLIAGRLTFP